MSNTFFKYTTLSFALLASQSVFADTAQPDNAKNQSNFELDPIVITVTRSEENTSTSPARIHVIQRQNIEQNPISNLNDVLKNAASVNMVATGGLGQQSSLFLRGTNSTHTLVLRDGVRLNTASAGASNSPFLDLSDIHRVEVLKGASSVLYGTDAIGGVIQLLSQKPEKTGGFITGVYGENHTYKAILGANLVQNGFYAQIRGQRVESDGTPVKDFIHAPKAPYDQKGGSAKIGYENQNFALSADYTQNQGNNAYDNFGMPTSQDFKNEIVNLKGRIQINPDVQIHARVSQFKDDLKQKDPNYLGNYDFANNTTKEYELYSAFKFTPQQTILLGATHRNLKGDILSFSNPYNETVKSTGYFAQHQYQSDKLNTQLGIRLEDNEKYGNHTVGQGAVSYHFTPNTRIYSNIGSAFRSPNLNELYAYGGNPDLKPEESLSYEIGLDQKIAENAIIGLSAYQTEIKNLIDQPDFIRNINIHKAKLKGGELYLKWKQHDYFANASYHYVQPKNKQTNEYLSRRPRHNASITVGLENEKYGLHSTVRAKSGYDNSGFDTVKIKGHATVNFHGYWNVNPNLKLFSNIENIGDVKYRTAFGSGSYFVNGGRQANIGLTLKY